MKYKQFIFLRNSVIVALVLGIGWFISSSLSENGLGVIGNKENTTSETVDIPVQDNSSKSNDFVANDNTETVVEYSLTTGETITAAHKEIMFLQKNMQLSAGKPDNNNGGVKLFKKMPTFQIDFRCDKKKGFDYFNRVKIDWDYDKQWDEKWDFRENGSIKRQCSTNDNNVYDLIQVTVDGKWQGENSSATTEDNSTSTVVVATENSDDAVTAMHKTIMSIQKNASLSEGKSDNNNGGVKLYKKMGSYFLDLRCDKNKGFDYFNRVKVDWDKDKNWDEKWDFRKDGSIKRQISTNDDKNYDVVKELKEGKWVKK
jgi:hypothetical protein